MIWLVNDIKQEVDTDVEPEPHIDDYCVVNKMFNFDTSYWLFSLLTSWKSKYSKGNEIWELLV